MAEGGGVDARVWTDPGLAGQHFVSRQRSYEKNHWKSWTEENRRREPKEGNLGYDASFEWGGSYFRKVLGGRTGVRYGCIGYGSLSIVGYQMAGSVEDKNTLTILLPPYHPVLNPLVNSQRHRCCFWLPVATRQTNPKKTDMLCPLHCRASRTEPFPKSTVTLKSIVCVVAIGE